MAGILESYGWTALFAEAFEAMALDGCVPGRVVASNAGQYRVISADGERLATLAGRVRWEAASAVELPAVGDWIALLPEGDEGGRIEALVPRRTKLSRKVAGDRTVEQVFAANVDTILVVMGLDDDYNLRRLERLVTMARESGACPVVLLNKADLISDLDARRVEVAGVAPGVEVVGASCIEGWGVDSVTRHLAVGKTLVVVGSSGAGKSTLINRLLGQGSQKTAAVRDNDQRGRHTTTHRELFLLPSGGLVIDSPGIREVQLWGRDETLARSFDDVEGLAQTCRFRDCSHAAEPGCAVVEAVADGRLDEARLRNFRSLREELRRLESRQVESAQRAETRKSRAVQREPRQPGRNRKR